MSAPKGTKLAQCWTGLPYYFPHPPFSPPHILGVGAPPSFLPLLFGFPPFCCFLAQKQQHSLALASVCGVVAYKVCGRKGKQHTSSSSQHHLALSSWLQPNCFINMWKDVIYLATSSFFVFYLPTSSSGYFGHLPPRSKEATAIHATYSQTALPS